jgi:hypothetical protein
VMALAILTLRGVSLFSERDSALMATQWRTMTDMKTASYQRFPRQDISRLTIRCTYKQTYPSLLPIQHSEDTQVSHARAKRYANANESSHGHLSHLGVSSLLVRVQLADWTKEQSREVDIDEDLPCNERP